MCSDACRVQKSASDPLKLELQVVVSHLAGALRITVILCNAAMAYNYPAVSPVFSLMVLVPQNI